jgi:phage FluMu protein Com
MADAEPSARCPHCNSTLHEVVVAKLPARPQTEEAIPPFGDVVVVKCPDCKRILQVIPGH